MSTFEPDKDELQSYNAVPNTQSAEKTPSSAPQEAGSTPQGDYGLYASQGSHMDQKISPMENAQQTTAEAPYNMYTAPQAYGAPPPKRKRKWGLALLTLLLLALVFGGGLFAGLQVARGGVANEQVTPQPTIPPLTGTNIEQVREAAVEKVRPSVVLITAETSKGTSLGSGVIVDKRGYIVTNNHVIEGGRNYQVTINDGTKLNAQVVGTDSLDDLAVLKVETKKTLIPATLGDSSKLRVGQEVLAIGNPLGNEQTVTKGIVSALNRTVSEDNGSGAILNAIQTDAPINPGNSGGALADLQGNVVGIPTLTAIDPQFGTPANGVGFAIPSNRVQQVVKQIIETGKVTNSGRAALNIQAADVDPFVAAQYNLPVDRGVLVAEVTQGGAAAKAGIRNGDVIVKIDDTDVKSRSDLTNYLLNKKPGDQVTIGLYRGNQQLTVKVTLDELKAQ